MSLSSFIDISTSFHVEESSENPNPKPIQNEKEKEKEKEKKKEKEKEKENENENENEKKSLKLELNQFEHGIFQLIFSNCEFSIVNIMKTILRDNQSISICSCREIHPLEDDIEMLIKMNPLQNCDYGQYRTKCIDVILSSLSLLTNKLFDANFIRSEVYSDKCEFDNKPGQFKIIIDTVDYGYANLIRRHLLDTVPVLGFSTIKIRRNTSILEDEVLAERIRLLPLCVDDGRIPTVNDTNCCFSLQKFISDTSDTFIVDVLSSEMVSSDENIKISFSKPGYGFPILALAPLQEIDLIAHTEINTAAHHSRFTSVSSISMSEENNQICLSVKSIGHVKPSVIIKAAIQSIIDSLVEIRQAIFLHKKPMMK